MEVKVIRDANIIQNLNDRDRDNIKAVISAVFHHFTGTLSALRKKVKHQPAIINTINHAKCSVVPGNAL